MVEWPETYGHLYAFDDWHAQFGMQHHRERYLAWHEHMDRNHHLTSQSTVFCCIASSAKCIFDKAPTEQPGNPFGW
jgi:hypothetical protein